MSPHHSTVGHPSPTNTTPTTNVPKSLHCWPPKPNQCNTNYQCPHITPLFAAQAQPIQRQLPMSPNHSTVDRPNPTNVTPTTNVPTSLHCWPPKPNHYYTNYQCRPHHSTVGRPSPTNATPTTNAPTSLHCWPPKPNQYNTKYQCPHITPLLASQAQPIQHQLPMSPTSLHCWPPKPNQ